MSAQSSDFERTGLVGATGFVGGALQRQTDFDARFNSQNIDTIKGQRFGTLVCAAAPGSMIEANTAPERDHAQINGLIERLAKVEAKQFILISSIAVFATFAGQDDEKSQNFQHSLAYGRHRRELEAFVEEQFDDHLIVRLPALFGRGLRKNFIFDLMNPVPSMLTAERLEDFATMVEPDLANWLSQLYARDGVTGMLKLNRDGLNGDPRCNALEEAVNHYGFAAVQFHNRDTRYQYYEIERLWRDITVARAAGLSHLHLTSEPITASAIHQHVLGRAMPETSARLHQEDMHCAYSELWGRSGPYLFDAATTLDRLEAFVVSERALA